MPQQRSLPSERDADLVVLEHGDEVLDEPGWLRLP